MAIFNKTEEGSKQADKPKSGKLPKVLQNVLVQPRISEKAGKLVAGNKYVFKVAKSANKISVKKAVETAYQVKVVMVNMINIKGKTKNYGRVSGKTSGFKKAVVTLKDGDKIEGTVETI